MEAQDLVSLELNDGITRIENVALATGTKNIFVARRMRAAVRQGLDNKIVTPTCNSDILRAGLELQPFHVWLQ